MEPQPAPQESNFYQKISTNPTFHWTKRFFIIFVGYISLFLIAKLLLIGLSSLFANLNCDPCWILGIIFFILFLPFIPLLFVESYFHSLGIDVFWSFVSLYLLGLLASILLGVLFGAVKNKKILGIVFTAIFLIGFLSYQIFVEDVLSPDRFARETQSNSSLDLTQEKKLSDLNTNKSSTKSADIVQGSWKVYRNEDLKIQLKYSAEVTTEFVAYMEDAGGENILGIKGPKWMEGTDFGSGLAIFAKEILASNNEEAAIKDRESIQKNWAFRSGEISCSISNYKLEKLQGLTQVCKGSTGINPVGSRYYTKNPNRNSVIRITTVNFGDEQNYRNYQVFLSDILSTFEFIN